MDPAAIHAATDGAVSGAEPLFAALDAGRGVVFALPHSGNWDAAGVWLVETLRRRGREPAFTTVAQRLRPESLYRRFVALPGRALGSRWSRPRTGGPRTGR